MKENVFIVHRSEIIRKGLSLILQEYFKMEITQLNSAKDLSSFLGISNSTMILILEAQADLNLKAIDLLKKNNDVYLVGFYAETSDEQFEKIFDYQLNHYSSPLQIQKLIQVIRQSGNKNKNAMQDNGELTSREKDVIKLISLGLANKEIADKLFISIHTVISHRKNITEKLGIKSISGLTVYAIMNNLLDIQDINPEELI
ncbi:helix-turn-helix transcriptional regulator [uncultured Sunxiuqinia sp.]|jgi:DNA-binding NarL/FixJ family response regulator|uniref:response regulator transcription factor n=1 Tax=uncultured Sunxiuqinia sp. TaxID=1573825 RepID=UPI0030DBD799|tara:strand:- start:56948 stop:57550 length:603 start_codon:yes stop_codon:yes gene_type:complete